MFDYAPEATKKVATRSDPRLLAMRFASRSGARFIRAAARIGGEHGAAVAHALCDMMIDATVEPAHWPIDEALALLRRPRTQTDAQVDRLVDSLSELRDRIDADFD